MTQSVSATYAGERSALAALARREIVAYLKHPLFLIGFALLMLGMYLVFEDPESIPAPIIPATTLGLFGISVMAGLVRRSDQRAAAAGTVVLTERERTYALAWASVVPFTAGLLYFSWAVWHYNTYPPAANTLNFDNVGDGWVYSWTFALGTLCALGGPLLGLVVGRWLHFRGAAILGSVVVVLLTIVFSGLVEPLQKVRVFWPWTYFGAPFGVEGDGNRWVVITGSPQWYCVYLVALCSLGVVVAALHDRELPRRTLVRAAGLLAVVALVLGTVTMISGPEKEVNPLPSSDAGS